MQTILPYSRDSTSAAMPVVCSCQSCSLLQIPAIPATREKNPQSTHQRLETRKSLPNLLPSWIPLSCCLRRVTTTRWTWRQQSLPSGKWAVFISPTLVSFIITFLWLFSNGSPEYYGRAYYVKTKFLHRQGDWRGERSEVRRGHSSPSFFYKIVNYAPKE